MSHAHGDGRSHADHARTSAGHACEPYAPVFVGDATQELDELLTRYPTKMAALLPALWMVQHERGWVSDDAMAEVAAVLDLTPAYVKGVVTFYTMYHQHPGRTAFHPGVHHVAVQRLRRRGRRQRVPQAHRMLSSSA